MVGHWTKSHLSRAEHAEKFGSDKWWMWFLNAEADRLCGLRSAEALSLLHVQDVKTIDSEAKARVSFLGRRCAQILCNAPKEKKTLATERTAKPKIQVVGPNKRHVLLGLVASSGSSGHVWKVTTDKLGHGVTRNPGPATLRMLRSQNCITAPSPGRLRAAHIHHIHHEGTRHG